MVDDVDEYLNAANDLVEEGEEQMNHNDGDALGVYNGRNRADMKQSRHSQSLKYHNIECLINSEYSITCRQDASGEVYLPFKFISKYFEV